MARNIKELSEQLAAFQKIVLDDLQALKRDTAQIKREIGEIRQIAESAQKKADANEKRINELEKNLARQSDRQRRRNMIIAGISEEITNKQLEGVLAKWLQDNGTHVQEIDIERAHRLYGRQMGGEPRRVIIAFAREKLKDEVFRTLRRIKDLEFRGKKVFVSHDFSPETLQEKRQLKPFAQRLYNAGINFTWGYPTTLIVFQDGKRYRARNPPEAIKMLDELGVDIGDPETQGSGTDPGEGTSAATSRAKRPRSNSQPNTR